MEGLSISLCFSPAYPRERSLPLAKELVAVLQRRNPLLQPHLSRTADLLAADRDEAFETLFRSLSLIQPWPGDKHGFSVSINQARDEKLDWALMSCHAGFINLVRAEVERAWLFMLSEGPALLEAASPLFAEIHALGESGIRFRGMVAGALPPVFGPWNYLSAPLLEGGRRAAIEALPDCKVWPLHTGLALQLVPDLYAKPGRELTAALRALGVKYHAKRAPT
jgi:hypothetical protein